MIYSESGPHLFLEQSATRQITEWKYNQDKKTQTGTKTEISQLLRVFASRFVQSMDDVRNNVMNTFLFIPNKLQTVSCKQKKMNDCLM